MPLRLPIFTLLGLFTLGCGPADVRIPSAGDLPPPGRAAAQAEKENLIPRQQAGYVAHGRAQAEPPGTGPPRRAASGTRAGVDPAAAVGPQGLIDAAVRALGRRRSLSAKIFQEIELFDKHLIGSGVYREQRHGAGRLFRLELKIQLDNETSSMVQVCDGRFLWTHRKLRDEGKLSRIDVARATEQLGKQEGMPWTGAMGTLPSFGGLPKMLEGLRAAFDFTSAQRDVLRLQSDQLPVWRLVGQWKPAELVKVLPRQKEAITSGKPVDLGELPAHLPDHVVLMLGQDDLFPYRMEYRRTASGDGEDQQGRPLVIVQMFEVVPDVAIDVRRFQYNPGGLKFDDRTEDFLKSIRPDGK